MRVVRNAIVAALFVFATMSAQPAFAAGVQSQQKIVQLTVVGSSAQSYAIVMFTNPATTPPACAVYTTAYVVEASTARGKLQLNLLTAAFLGGKRVTVTGTGSCLTVTGFPYSTETAAYVTVE